MLFIVFHNFDSGFVFLAVSVCNRPVSDYVIAVDNLVVGHSHDHKIAVIVIDYVDNIDARRVIVNGRGHGHDRVVVNANDGAAVSVNEESVIGDNRREGNANVNAIDDDHGQAMTDDRHHSSERHYDIASSSDPCRHTYRRRLDSAMTYT